MTPQCINHTDRKPAYRLEGGVVGNYQFLFRLVTDDDGLVYKQQLNADGTWSEWHDSDWLGDPATAHLTLVPLTLPAPPILPTGIVYPAWPVTTTNKPLPVINPGTYYAAIYTSGGANLITSSGGAS